MYCTSLLHEFQKDAQWTQPEPQLNVAFLKAFSCLYYHISTTDNFLSSYRHGRENTFMLT